MVPFLGSSLKEIIQNNELKIIYDGKRFVFNYHGSLYPLNLFSYSLIINSSGDRPLSKLEQLLAPIQEINPAENPSVFFKQWEEVLLQLNSLEKNDETGKHIEQRLEKINADHDLLQKIADQQYYTLCHWQETDSKINYRRFFTVNGLICLNIQDSNVFNQYHELIKLLTDEEVFQGLRIDHIDGLYDPAGYQHRIKELAGEHVYITIEKILQPGESLPQDWKVEGTTGYDFLALVNNLFTNKKNEHAFTNFYEELTGNYNSGYDQLLEKKFTVLFKHMKGELDNLYELLLSLVDKKLLASIYPTYLKEAIAEFLIHCPVYRFYGNKFPLEPGEAAAVEEILNNIQHSGKVKASVIDILRKALLQKPMEGNDE